MSESSIKRVFAKADMIVVRANHDRFVLPLWIAARQDADDVV